MGVVYRAEDTRLKRAVALKFLPYELSGDAGAKERFLREAQAASRLDHTNICTVHEIGEAEDGQLYIVMAYYPGETLKQRITRGPLGVEEALDLGRQIASGLAKAHAHDVVHRDVKPANVLITAESEAKILDFGLAKVAGETALTNTGSSVGTPLYMSPEQIGGESDERTDIWSLGVVLYEMLTGQRPFGGGSSASAMYSILHREPTPLAMARPGMPEDVQPIVDRALAKDLGRRYPTMALLADDLAEAGAAEASVTQPMLSLPSRVKVKRSRRPWLATLLAISLSVTALILVTFFKQPAESMDAPASTAPAEDPLAVAVLPFSFRGGAELAYLGEGMVDLLATKLDGAGDLRSIDPRALLSDLGGDGDDGEFLDPSRAAVIGRRFDADLFILGNIVEVAGQLRFDARLYRAGEVATELTSATAEGEAGEIFALVDRLAAQLLAARQQGPAARVSRLAAVTTESFPALKAYLDGESAYRDGRVADAARAFEAATTEDPGFALAWYRLSIMAEWLVDAELAAAAAMEAARNAERLSEHDRQVVEAHAAYSCGRGREAERLFREILRRHPDDVEAWIGLAETEFHYGPMFGRSRLHSRRSWEQVAAFEADDFNALLHLARLDLYERDYPRLAQRAARLEVLLAGTDRMSEVRFYQAHLPGGAAVLEGMNQQVSRASLSLDWMPASFFSGSSWTDPERWLPTIEMLLDGERTERDRAYAHRLLGVLKLSLGRLAVADRELRQASSPTEAAEEYRALAATVPFLSLPPERLEELRTVVESWPRAAPGGMSSFSPIEPHAAFPGHLRAYVLGLLEARLGRPERALALAEELEALGEIPHAVGLHQDLAAGVRAEVARLAGDPERVLALLADREGHYSYQLAVFSPLFSQVRERWMQAEALFELDRLEEADGWYESLAELNLFDLSYLAMSHLRRAEIADRLGRSGDARGHYRRFLGLWRDGDDELRPLIAEAEAAAGDTSSAMMSR